MNYSESYPADNLIEVTFDLMSRGPVKLALSPCLTRSCLLLRSPDCFKLSMFFLAPQGAFIVMDVKQLREVIEDAW